MVFPTAVRNSGDRFHRPATSWSGLPPPVRRRWILLCAVALVAVPIAFLVLPREEEAPATIPAALLPLPGGPEGYAGSAECRDCHPGEYRSWHRSYHRTMTQVVSEESVLADFDDVTLEHRGESFRLGRSNGVHRVTIGQPPDAIHLPLTLVTGSHHMQVFWMPAGHGNLQVGFPFTWLIEDRRWVPRHDTFIRDPESEPPFEFWNLACIRCHTTGGIPKPDQEAGVYRTEAVELGIACEACHGSAREHAALHRIGEPVLSDPVVRPADLPPQASAQVCGQCHSMKWFDRSEGWEHHGFRYRPGDDLEETTPVIRASRTEEQPWLQPVLDDNPDLLGDFFWPDGMIRVTGREYNGLLESECHTTGGMTCLDCHTMHKGDPDDQLRPTALGSTACTGCHEGYGEEHTRHRSGSPGSLCYNCHMPHTAYGILKAIRSHQIDSPSVVVEQATGRPNACNLCHTDRTLEWTALRLEEWFGQAVPALSRRERTVPAVPAIMLAGDAGQRALAAWALGHQDSRQASGDDWQAGVLSHALDDPYAAVRYIAGKSLGQLPGMAGFGTDFAGPPEERSRATSRALALWRNRRPPVSSRIPAPGFFGPDGYPLESVVRDLLRQQDRRPVRLRE